ncbi:ATP-binding cassette domain-containing protein [Paracoccus sp. YIM 132242]|uniref:ATP-binding cassette domain-containing protein n=1 Tax=Paracoccus lichenicola TaxID=2665644 RepID=A0A6L6HP98_9RHOB|nr:ABC transporter ATP-binding protein [Paracoccus lichenicola]MTE00013.1 ATP-binding cassette domain-containing protein [Paracoccus lichenicola]
MTGVELRDIGVTLAGRPVLQGVSARLEEPRVGIVGRNGSGKTTLARVIAGLVAPDAGQARIDGADMAADRRAALATVGIIFQNPDHQIIFPTVLEEIAFGLTQQGQRPRAAEAAARAMLDRFGKGHWAPAATHSLSQGQKQLLCLMAVLAMRPRVVVMDEPFSGLDIPTRLQLMRYLDGIAAQVVMITHDPGQLRGFDRILWLEGGRLIADGPPDAVLPRFEAQMREWGGLDDLAHLAG